MNVRYAARLALALVVSTALILVLIKTIDPQALVTALTAARRSDLLLAFFATALAWVLMAVKWRTLVHQHISTATALSLTFRSLFYGFVLPGQVASDVYRSVVFMRRGIAALGVASVITDRVLGLLALVVVGFAGAIFSPGLRATQSWAWVMTATVILGIACIGALVVLPQLSRLFLFWNPPPKSSGHRFHARLQSLADAFSSFPPATRLRAFLYSFLFQMLCVLALFFLGEAFGADVTLPDWAWVFAVASVVLLLPISIGGIGLREGTLVGALGLIGVSAGISLPIGIALTLMTSIGALAGAFLEVATLLHRRR